MKYISSRPLLYILTAVILILIGSYYSYSVPFQKQFPEISQQGELGETRQVSLTTERDPSGREQLPENLPSTDKPQEAEPSQAPTIPEEKPPVSSPSSSTSGPPPSAQESFPASSPPPNPSEKAVSSGVKATQPGTPPSPAQGPGEGAASSDSPKIQKADPPSPRKPSQGVEGMPSPGSPKVNKSSKTRKNRVPTQEQLARELSTNKVRVPSKVVPKTNPSVKDRGKVVSSLLASAQDFQSTGGGASSTPPQPEKSQGPEPSGSTSAPAANPAPATPADPSPGAAPSTSTPNPTPTPSPAPQKEGSQVTTPSSQSQSPANPAPSRTRRPRAPSPSGKPQAPAPSQPAQAPSGKPQAPAPSQPAQAPTQQPPPPSETRPGEEAPKVALSLEEAINLALVNNFDIAIERFNPKIETENIVVAESVFDPIPFANVNAAKNLSPTASQVTGSEQETVDFNAGLQQTLSPGTTYQVTFNNNRTDTNSALALINPAYRSNMILTLTQPLLRGFGSAVNRAPILIARNNRDISVSELRNRVIEVISDVQTTYWDLVFAIGDLDAKRLSLRLAQDLVRINRAQVEVGTLAPIEILQAESSAAAREEAVLVAEETLRDTEDRLKRILNFRGGDPKFWDATIIPLDKPPFQPKEVSVEEGIQIALQKRPEVVQARLNLENTNINVVATRSQLLPTVNFQGSLGLNGLGSSYGDNLNELTSGDFYAWQAGVNFEYPIGNRAAKSNHAIARLQAEQAEVSIKNIEQQVVLDVRQAVRQIRTDIKRVESTRIARELAERQLDAEQKKFNEGLSTNFNVLQFQEDLSNAVSNEVRAITDYNKSLVNLERFMGTTLESKNIKVE